MKLNMNSLTRTANKFGLTCKKYAPQALIVTGVTGIVASGVMACKATLKANDILDDHKDQMNKIYRAADIAPQKYTEEDKKKDTVTVYAQTGIKFAKLYGPAIILGTVSIACIIGSHRIMTKRNAALAAAYKIVDTQFKEYRGRVVERFGEKLDKELRYNIRSQEIEEIVVDEDGNETIEKKTVEVADPSKYSDFAKIFDESCNGWTKDPEANLYFLRTQMAYANDKLKRKGYLFLNEVYAMLGIPENKAGQVVGWIYDEKNPIGDNFVDFGIYDTTIERHRAFVNGYERSIVLDFNVDGNILDLI